MQNKEIELKFGIEGNQCNLRQIFSKIGTVSDEQELHLDNTYFDTDKKELFAIRAGLRIRHADNFSEQTLKVKGQNIGGLHQRSEFNLPIDSSASVPNLKAFPKEAFPADFNLDDLQKRLKKVCRINFTRKLFNLNVLDSTFEVAYDSGYIEVEGNKKYPLNELELELKETSVKEQDLLKLCSLVCNYLAQTQLPLLLEPFSKMHRASLLQQGKVISLNLAQFDSQNTTVKTLTNLVASFEQLYGYFIVSRDATVLALVNCVLHQLLEGLKMLKRKHLLAFVEGQIEPVDYKTDLKIIIRLLKDFYKTSSCFEKKLLKVSLNNNQKLVTYCVEKVREAEKNTKLFLIPLKLRLLLSLLA